jgi:transposase
MADDQSYEGSYEARLSAHKSDVSIEVRQVRKRIWTQAEKLSIMREAFQPGAIPAEIMRRHGITSSLFYTWRKRFLAAAPAGFMPVRVAEPAEAKITLGSTNSPPSRGPDDAHNAAIEIKTQDGTTVRINGAVDARILNAVLKAVCG